MRVSKKILQAVAWLVLIGVLFAAGCAFGQNVELRPALTADLPLVGVGRAETETATVSIYTSPVCRDGYHSVWHYTEGDGEPPYWYDPDEEMAVEWTAPERRDGGCPDWNVDSTLYGWDGHTMEAWEMDLFARIFYREFWQPNLMLCEAGCDAMLGLWELDGGTMYETLSHINEDGSYSFSTFPGVWESEYDPDGLAWCRAYCEERFYEGPSWPAQYFRKGHYHDWGEWSPIPAYEIDGIYFSMGKER